MFQVVQYCISACYKTNMDQHVTIEGNTEQGVSNTKWLTLNPRLRKEILISSSKICSDTMGR